MKYYLSLPNEKIRAQKGLVTVSSSQSKLDPKSYLEPLTPKPHILYFILFFKAFIYLFLEREREKKKERNIDVWLPLEHPLLQTWPAAQSCALTRNLTGDPWFTVWCSVH